MNNPTYPIAADKLVIGTELDFACDTGSFTLVGKTLPLPGETEGKTNKIRCIMDKDKQVRWNFNSLYCAPKASKSHVTREPLLCMEWGKLALECNLLSLFLPNWRVDLTTAT